MTGIINGMVMQRNEQGVSEILVSDISEIHAATYVGAKSGTLTWIECEQGFKLIGIPVGGPYTVHINEEKFHDIYVGDLWILAGQSNMQGVGWLTKEDEEFLGEEDVRAFYMQDEWGKARHRLHRPWLAIDKVHTEALPSACVEGVDEEKRGVGPGLAFAQKMREFTGVPQGVICCAHGGTTMAHQNEFFMENMERFFSAVREVCGMIPIVQVQIGNITVVEREPWDRDWTDLREQQRAMANHVPLLDTISAISYATDDAVHLCSEEQKKVGTVAAESMQALLMPNGEYLPAPVYKGHKVYATWLDGFSVIDIEYDNVYGELQAEGKPSGFEISYAEDQLTNKQVCNIALEGNHVLVRVGRKPEQLEGWKLFYGFGVNPYCNIMDGHGRKIPAMGPILLEITK